MKRIVERNRGWNKYWLVDYWKKEKEIVNEDEDIEEEEEYESDEGDEEGFPTEIQLKNYLAYKHTKQGYIAKFQKMWIRCSSSVHLD